MKRRIVIELEANDEKVVEKCYSLATTAIKGYSYANRNFVIIHQRKEDWTEPLEQKKEPIKTKQCPACLELIPADATRCSHCTSIQKK